MRPCQSGVEKPSYPEYILPGTLGRIHSDIKTGKNLRQWIFVSIFAAQKRTKVLDYGETKIN